MADHKTDATALILVDVQNDFLPPDGSLAVTNGRAILPVIHKLLSNPSVFDLIIATLVYHPPGHVSFASTHKAQPFTLRDIPKLHEATTTPQMLWPDHCVQGTQGCEIEPTIQKRLDAIEGVQYVRKGTNLAVDAYSGFADNQYTQFTSLPQILHTHGIKKVIITGLATDYCVKFTAIDARKFGFKTLVVEDAVRAVDPSKVDTVVDELKEWGCEIIAADTISKQ
ncbi:uncharacterized protein EI90DRAFT_2967482 [Cantharellus anzutake]|uniref:uncharacterized protein n=1 Tax=Cantharellus anzutake TaxID=1750568 RepID=UPI0019088A6A|nr:uncharacterized protein EI90DRAFT_2967482 [Cantharellus anzutake]KAF8339006.1 hypothetical protein EI90DRAFT_2967482 [Cantharellus anzutake]